MAQAAIREPKLPQVSAGEHCHKAAVILKSAHASATALLDAFKLTRERRGTEGASPRGMTTHAEQDCLRAMLVMAAAGLDAMMKQIVRDALPALVASDDAVKEEFEKFISRRIRGEGGLVEPASSRDFLARILAAPSHQSQAIEEYIQDLAGGSLQSPKELMRISQALGLRPLTKENQRKLRKIFDIRNDIIHELDINFAEPRRIRNMRRVSDMTAHANALLATGYNILTEVVSKLTAIQEVPAGMPAPAQARSN